MAIARAQVTTCSELWDLDAGDPADVNHDCRVNLNDLIGLAGDWLDGDFIFGVPRSADIDRDCRIDLGDFNEMAPAWQTSSDPAN